MNIFFLSTNVKRCARYHFDKHVVKMILELTQLLSTAWFVLDEEQAVIHHSSGRIYKKTHTNHPCAVWTRKHANNYYYVAKLGLALCDEWRYRYNHPTDRSHGCEDKLLFMVKHLPSSIGREFIPPSEDNPYGWTLPLPQAMPDECRRDSGIDAYRCYYQSQSKITLRGWTKRNVPWWFDDSEVAADGKTEESQTTVVNVKVAHIRPKYKNLKEWCEDPDNVYITRRGVVFVDGERYPKKDSPFANPFKITKDNPREKVVKMYRKDILAKIKRGEVDIESLRGKTLGCWCKPEACHGDILIEILESLKK